MWALASQVTSPMRTHKNYEALTVPSNGGFSEPSTTPAPAPAPFPGEPESREGRSGFIGSMARVSRRFPGVRLTLFLLLVVAAVNAVALWGIFAARRGALETARHELALETAAHARSLEAVLATLRGDLAFLSHSPLLMRYQDTSSSGDPLVRRWSRLDAEAALLLFLEAHPAVHRLELRRGDGEVLLLTGRLRGAPAVLPPESRAADVAGPETGARLWHGSFALGPRNPDGGTTGTVGDSESGALEVRIDPSALLAVSAPGYEDRLRLLTAETGDGEETAVPASIPISGPGLVARAPFSEEQWSPPLRGTLLRSETESRLVASVESLAGRYRTTVVLYSLVMTLTLVLGTVALRQSRKAAHLEAARRHEAQVRELERQLFHSERLASLGRLAAGMAHEINNPLEGMANYLSLLEEDLKAGRTDGTSELAGRLRQGLERAAGAVQQVLAFADPARSPKERLDLTEVLTEAVEFLHTHPAHRGVRLELEIAERPLRVRGNRVTLGQLFLNLLLNACQVQPSGGEVRVLARTEDDRVQVEIVDRGPGLPPELGGRIFEPFVSTRTSSGLGLAVCHGIVEDHRGTIRGDNRDDGGAVFEVSLPAAEDTDSRRVGADAGTEPVHGRPTDG